ncbi:hypothetical protein [Priestia aryabhattai]
MKSKKTIFSVATLFILASIFSFNGNASAASHSNSSYKVYTVTQGNGVPFTIGVKIGFEASVNSSKVITREAISMINEQNCNYPFSSNVHTGQIKYFKDGSLRTTHRPANHYNILHSSCWAVDGNQASPNSQLSKSSKYTAQADGTWSSTQTFPGTLRYTVSYTNSLN